MARYTWAPAKKKPGIKISDALKNEVKVKADSLIGDLLKPKYIQPPLKTMILTTSLILPANGIEAISISAQNTIVPPQMRWPLPLIAILLVWNMSAEFNMANALRSASICR